MSILKAWHFLHFSGRLLENCTCIFTLTLKNDEVKICDECIKLTHLSIHIFTLYITSLDTDEIHIRLLRIFISFRLHFLGEYLSNSRITILKSVNR
jgi:hypothetical protein